MHIYKEFNYFRLRDREKKEFAYARFGPKRKYTYFERYVEFEIISPVGFVSSSKFASRKQKRLSVKIDLFFICFYFSIPQFFVKTAPKNLPESMVVDTPHGEREDLACQVGVWNLSFNRNGYYASWGVSKGRYDDPIYMKSYPWVNHTFV